MKYRACWYQWIVGDPIGVKKHHKVSANTEHDERMLIYIR